MMYAYTHSNSGINTTNYLYSLHALGSSINRAWTLKTIASVTYATSNWMDGKRATILSWSTSSIRKTVAGQ